MGSALSSALSGLRVHQQFLDVIGNNLANSNTPGYRGSRVTFADVLSQLVRSGSAPSGTVGGINPVQVGLGVSIHSIDTRTSQGVLDDTGNPFDLAIQGEGFFVLNAGGRNVYTRAGVFGLDTENFMVDTASGFRVRSTSGADIQLPVNTLLPAEATSEINLGGNLPAQVTGPVAEVLTTTSPFQEGTEAQIIGSGTQPFALNAGDSLSVRVDGGAPVSVTFDATNITVGAATAAEVAAVLNGIAGLTASADPAGFVVIVSDRTGAGSSLDVDDVSGAPAGLLGLTTSLVRGTETFAQSSTLLNDLAGNITDYVAGDGIDVSGTGVDGTPFGGTFIIGPGNDTLGDLVTFINSLMPDATAAIDGSGNISITADTESEASLTLSLADGTSNTGATSFSSSGFKVTTEGRGPDEVRTSIDVFDSRGLRHTLTFTFTRIDEIEWDLSVATDNNKDTLIDNQINGIRFDEDGAFSAVTGSGTGGVGIEILFDGLTTSQSIDVSLGTSDQLDGVTQLGLSGSLRALSQDGHASGDLESVSVRSDGVIEGFYSNGQSQDLDQVALAVFANPGGLMRLGNSSYEESPNSGIAQLQIPGSGGAGSVFSGVLESSNVDVAEEFVRLIEAQRGFQANARVIRVSDELLVELVNLV